jgi:hypothetical protein
MILREALILSRDSILFSPESIDFEASLMVPAIITTMIPISAIEIISSRRVKPLLLRRQLRTSNLSFPQVTRVGNPSERQRKIPDKPE